MSDVSMRLKLISDNSKQTTDCERLQHKNTSQDLIQQPSHECLECFQCGFKYL